MHQYVLTDQQMSEQEIGVKLSEDDLMMRCMICGARARRGRGRGSQ
jgi:hypothetical protein